VDVGCCWLLRDAAADPASGCNVTGPPKPLICSAAPPALLANRWAAFCKQTQTLAPGFLTFLVCRRKAAESRAEANEQARTQARTPLSSVMGGQEAAAKRQEEGGAGSTGGAAAKQGTMRAQAVDWASIFRVEPLRHRPPFSVHTTSPLHPSSLGTWVGAAAWRIHGMEDGCYGHSAQPGPVRHGILPAGSGNGRTAHSGTHSAHGTHKNTHRGTHLTAHTSRCSCRKLGVIHADCPALQTAPSFPLQ